MRLILKEAISFRGTSISDFRDTAGKPGGYSKKLLTYGRDGKPCKRCGHLIKKIKLNSRATHYCPKCQKSLIK